MGSLYVFFKVTVVQNMTFVLGGGVLNLLIFLW